MKRLRRQGMHDGEEESGGRGLGGSGSMSHEKRARRLKTIGRFLFILVGCLVLLPLLAKWGSSFHDFSLNFSGFPSAGGVTDDRKVFRVVGFGKNRLASDSTEERMDYADHLLGFGHVTGGRNLEGEIRKENESSQSIGKIKDKLLGGLLYDGFDEGTCLSRYRSAFYRKTPLNYPSQYLVDKLRKYENLHRQCAPYTKSYNQTVRQLKSGGSADNESCQYIVWISYSGLGNKMLTIAATFLYALLTDRVLLVDHGTDLSNLFCEPFPESSWMLPLDFPLREFKNLGRNSSSRYGLMLEKTYKGNNNASASSPPKFMYLHLSHDYDHHDKLFFCDDEQLFLERVPWLFVRTDNYFVPSLFLMPKFDEELSKLFPDKDMVFHHLGRYIFHPTNAVWGMITRFYDSYLSFAEERVGVQIRTFETQNGPFRYVLDQILSCAEISKLLPKIATKGEPVRSSHVPVGSSKAILVTSLTGGYYEWIKNMYWEDPTKDGEVVSVYQPSHEEYQQTGSQMHNMKALAEIYLLSLSDALMTSAWSTFGYVAHGLSGIKPWILTKPENRTVPDPPCRLAMSTEPCFHAPPFYDCKAKAGTDTGKIVSHVTHCEDMSWGLKVVGKDAI